MNRVSDITSREDLVRELQREELRDRRWARRRDQLEAGVTGLRGVVFIALLVSAVISAPHLIPAFLRLLA